MNKLTAWIKDYAHLFSVGTIMYLRRMPPRHYLDHKIQGKTPIVILPGLFARWGFYKSLADYISLLGHPVYIVPKLGNNLNDIKTSAEKVREVIKENNLKNTILLAHSKGGLIGKYLLLNENSDGSIKGLIAIATPFHGSSIGKFIPYSAVQELYPTSKIINYLNEHREVNEKIVSIFPSYDNHVWHSKGSFLEGALENIKVEMAGHHTILSDKKVWNEIVGWIEKITKL